MSTLIFTNARVFEGSGFSAPQSFAVTDGKIVSEPDPQARRIDLGGHFVMPGFIESHAHPEMLGKALLNLDLRPQAVSSVDDILDKIALAVANAKPGVWIRGSGWDETYLSDGRGPTKAELDVVAPRNPVVLTRTCTHMFVVNSEALTTSGISCDVEDPQGGRFVRDGLGALTGLIQEAAMDQVQVPNYADHEEEQAFRLAQEAFVGWGVTTVHDLSASAAGMRRYSQAERSGKLKMRVRPWLWALSQSAMKGLLDSALGAGISSGFGNDMLRIQGVKFTLDGSVGGRTAAVCCSFEDLDDCGLLYLADNDFIPELKRAVEGGLRLAIHGIGERAIEQALDALDQLDKNFVTNQRIRLEHCALPTHGQLERIRDNNIIAASSIGFIHHLGDSYIKALGFDRASRAYPQRTFQEWGICAPGNSDSPVTDGNPWGGIYSAVTRTTKSGVVLGEEESISLSAAIRAYTNDAAYTSFEEHEIGVLSPGACADIQVLDQNPYEMEPSEWLNLTPTAVYLGGQLVYERS
ncbi:amidohydrolase [Yaniella halotolerans]|uniref:amidohydrolase n=1 Tax=Yaniella halotolerans TaxID=225453 RepID=UPI0003B3D208|nr:amidohydrolase [Yaniella halotolerans]